MADIPSGRNWQLFEHGLLVFEQALGPSGPSRLLVSRVELCSERDCSCREASLKAISIEVVDSDFDRAGLSSEGLRAKFASNDAMNALLDIDLGLVEPDQHEGRVPLSAEWIQYVQSQIDGELLDLLHERWLRAKGATSNPTSDWPPRDPAELVGWDEAHPDDRQDLYLDDDVVVAADDMYCLNPNCTCSEVRVVFAKTVRGAPPIGSVRIQLPSGEVISRESKPAKTAILNRLWNAFSTRHRVAERLEKRQQQMRELARVRAQTQKSIQPIRAAKSVGRNELCPCGSGKKYKRCCAA